MSTTKGANRPPFFAATINATFRCTFACSNPRSIPDELATCLTRLTGVSKPRCGRPRRESVRLTWDGELV